VAAARTLGRAAAASARRPWATVAAVASRRPSITVAGIAALAVAGGALALSLRPSVADDTLVSSSSASYRATEADYRQFGSAPVIVLVREPLAQLFQVKDLTAVSKLEACLAGEVVVPDEQLEALVPAPPGALAPYGGRGSPCAELMRHRPVQVVYGPGTFLNRAVAAVNQELVAIRKADAATVQHARALARSLAQAQHLTPAQVTAAARAAGALKAQQLAKQLAQLASHSGLNGYPAISDAQFLSQVVFDPSRGSDVPKARFSYLFPTRDAALIQVRLKAGLSQAQTARAIAWIREAVAMPQFHTPHGARYTVTGEPVVVDELASQITGSIVVLLLGAIVVMALTLLLVFGGPLPLLPLAIALAAAAVTFGATSLAGATLTMASIAVLPILIGLAVDYAVQFQSRARERAAPAGQSVVHAALRGAPTIAAAALATATGFLVLVLSPTPMVRGFGLLLVVGTAIALLCTLAAGSAALVIAERELGRVGAALRGARQIFAEAREILADARGRLPARPRLPSVRAPGPGAIIPALTRRPLAILSAGLVLAVGGWIADTQTAVQSDITKLVPSSTPALRDLEALERVTGVSGEIDVTVHAADVATPATVAWMTRYERRLLRHFGYAESRGCAAATLCPALSLPDLFAQTGAGSSAGLTGARIDALLAAVPRYFSRAVISADRRAAVLAFGIRLMPLAEQQRVLDYMRANLHPPSGVSAELAGLPVLAAQADAALSSSGRRLLTLLAGLVAVALVLLAAFRAPRRALVPLVPIALATGWSALIVFAIGIPLNPMSATLGALVLAISTEFSVLLSERYREERAAGRPLDDALARAYGSTGRAVLASGVTAIAGFGVLMLSDITMLRDFGLVTVVDLTASLLGVLLVLPAALALVERGGVAERLRAVGVLAAALPRRRRRARVA
jgi:uncharacterized protein